MNRSFKKLSTDYWPYLSITLQLTLGACFIYAGATKAFYSVNFADDIASFKILPHDLIYPTALTLPILEYISGSILILPFIFSSVKLGERLRRLGFLSILILSLLFSLALLSASIRGINVDCGCFGHNPLKNVSNWALLTRDVIILGLALVGYRLELNRCQTV